LKPRFQKQYAVQSNDKLIIQGLANLTMNPSENTWDLLKWVTDKMVSIKESFASYRNKAMTLVTDNCNGYMTATTEQLNRDTVNNVMQFFKMQLFQVGLPSELRHVLA
jgi:hypothetical protein